MLNIRKSFDGNDRVCLGAFLRYKDKDKRSPLARFFHVEVRLRVGIFATHQHEGKLVRLRNDFLAWRIKNLSGSLLDRPPPGTCARDRFIGSGCILLAFGKEVLIFPALANAT